MCEGVCRITCSNDGVHEKCDPSLCCEVDVQLGVLSQQGLQSTHITRVTCFHHTLHQWVGGGHDEGGVLKVVCRTKFTVWIPYCST